jgi:hypothetical protein
MLFTFRANSMLHQRAMLFHQIQAGRFSTIITTDPVPEVKDEKKEK